MINHKDEYRTPPWLGGAMAKAAGLEQFDLDPFCGRGFNGIPAKRRFVYPEQDALALPWGEVRSIGFNVPFSTALNRACLERLVLATTTGATKVVGIVRSDTSTKWWRDLIRPNFPTVALLHRVSFVDRDGRPTLGQPRGGIAVVARGVDPVLFAGCLVLACPHDRPPSVYQVLS